MDALLQQMMTMTLALFALLTIGLAFWSISLWLFCRIVVLLRRRKKDEHQPRAKKETELHPDAELPPRWVVWGRRETRRGVSQWEPFYVGDDRELMINQARVELPSKGFGLILLENGEDPQRIYRECR